MALNLHPEKNTQYETPRGIVYVRFYTVSKGGYAANKPAKGSLLPGETGLLGARAKTIKRWQPKGKDIGALDGVEVHYEELSAYAAASAALAAVELLNSRRTWEEGNKVYAERLFVSDDKDSEISRGDTYPDDSGLGAAYRRVALTPRLTEEDMPGRYFHQVIYVNFIAHASGNLEIIGSGRTWEEGNKLYAERLFVSTNNSSGIARGATLPADSGLDEDYRRVALTPGSIVETFPGRYLHRVTYVNFIAHASGSGEILGSRRTWSEGRRTFAERLFVTTDGNSGVAENDLYPADTAPDGKYALAPENTTEIFPGRYLSRVIYVGQRSC